MFSPEARALVRDGLVERARTDPQIAAAALVGSAAAGREDAWSDIDLALRLAPGLTPAEAIDTWTATIYHEHQAVAHTDLWSGTTLYRVFLLADSLQVDLSLWPFDEFGQRGGDPFLLIFGDASKSSSTQEGSPLEAITGMAWLYALHARSSIARGRGLQAVYMLNGLRDQITSLVCVRAGLPSSQGRGLDDLPESIKATVASTLVSGIKGTELQRSFGALIDLLKQEIRLGGAGTVDRIATVLDELVRTARQV